jgi:hypothetical protein
MHCDWQFYWRQRRRLTREAMPGCRRDHPNSEGVPFQAERVVETSKLALLDDGPQVY